MMLEPVPVTFSLDAFTHAEFVFVNQDLSVKKDVDGTILLCPAI